MRNYIKRFLPLGLTLLLLGVGIVYSVSMGRAAESRPTELAAAAPCGGGSCDVRNVSGFAPFAPLAGSGAALELPPAGSVEEVLEEGLHLAGASPVHLAVRGTADEGSLRCEWRGVARTNEPGRALGMSDFAPLASVTSQDYKAYGASHPTIAGSIMNYFHQESDCSPHSLNIMAVFALYQSKLP